MVAIFYKIPSELWDKIFYDLPKRDLNVAAKVSRQTYRPANILLYRRLEISFGRCSEAYCSALQRTIVSCSDLASLVKELVLDATLGCSAWLGDSVAPPADLENAKRDVQSVVSERIQSVLASTVEDMLPYLKNIEMFKFVRAESAAPDATRLPTLTALGLLYGAQVHSLCLHDASLRDNRDIFQLYTALKSLDLGYSDVASKDLAALLNKNTSSLETVKLNGVGTMPQNSLFVGFAPSAPFVKLRELHVTGQMKVSVDDTFMFLQSCPALRGLHIDDLEDTGAINWAKVLVRLAEVGSHKSMQHLSLGGPKTTCYTWWLSVAKFLDHLDGSLESLMIHARQIGTSANTVADMPEVLRFSCLYSNGRHWNLKSLVIIWRAVRGMTYDTVTHLAQSFPNLELLHCYIVHPDPDTLTELIETVAQFKRLKRLHFISPATTTSTNQYPQPDNLPPSLAGIHIAGADYPWAPYFLAGVMDRCPNLERVSWIRHEPWREANEDCLFVHVFRDAHGAITKCESLVTSHYTSPANPASYTYNVRLDTPLTLAQPPTWCENMGQKLAQEGNVCKRARIGYNAAN